ncbi:MAG TPA: SpoIID/LytB domain-containing protein [Dongiaceae bacterium]|nr:SpoIID/LytB domain-containing protein [Dongiaceae bacterium]
MKRLVALGSLIFLVSCAAPHPVPPTTSTEKPQLPEPPIVRVALFTQVSDVQVGATESFAMGDGDGTIAIGAESDVIGVRRDGTRIALYTANGELMETAAGFLRIEPQSEGGLVTVNGARYPGAIEVVPASTGGGLQVINVVDVETYLRGVVPLEMGMKGVGLLEAAKAQAIAARTYVAGHMGQYRKEKFDLYAGVTDQVYGPVDRRHPDADLAVAQTRGLILVFDGRPIRANYASTCGGNIAGVEESFPSPPIAYLRSHEDRFGTEIACRTSRFYRWDALWTGDELKQVLSRTVPRVLGKPWKGSVVKQIEVLGTGASGRALRLRVTTDEESYVAEKGAIRELLESPHGQPLRSTNFEMEMVRRGDRVSQLTLHGRGWGHGVGMCQWGAMQLSQEGVTFNRILGHYYPGADLKSWYPTGPFDRTAEGGKPNHG